MRLALPLLLFAVALSLSSARTAPDDPAPSTGPLVFDGNSEIDAVDLQSDEELGDWGDPASSMGKIRANIQDVVRQDPDLLAWFCEIDKRILDGDIGLVRYEPSKTGVTVDSGGLSDGVDTAGLSEEVVTDLKEKEELDEEKGRGDDVSPRADASSTLFHELAHINHADDSDNSDCDEAGAYEQQMRFVLCMFYLSCHADGNYYSDSVTTTRLSQRYEEARKLRDDFAAACVEATDEEGDPESPVSDYPEDLPELPEVLPDCDGIEEFFPYGKGAEEGGGDSDPTDGEDDNPCPEDPEEEE